MLHATKATTPAMSAGAPMAPSDRPSARNASAPNKTASTTAVPTMFCWQPEPSTRRCGSPIQGGADRLEEALGVVGGAPTGPDRLEERRADDDSLGRLRRTRCGAGVRDPEPHEPGLVRRGLRPIEELL